MDIGDGALLHLAELLYELGERVEHLARFLHELLSLELIAGLLDCASCSAWFSILLMVFPAHVRSPPGRAFDCTP